MGCKELDMTEQAHRERERELSIIHGWNTKHTTLSPGAGSTQSHSPSSITSSKKSHIEISGCGPSSSAQKEWGFSWDIQHKNPAEEGTNEEQLGYRRQGTGSGGKESQPENFVPLWSLREGGTHTPAQSGPWMPIRRSFGYWIFPACLEKGWLNA